MAKYAENPVSSFLLAPCSVFRLSTQVVILTYAGPSRHSLHISHGNFMDARTDVLVLLFFKVTT